MKLYKDYQPTGFDCKGLGLPDRQDWYVAPVIRTRDSGPLDNANFEAFLKELNDESDYVEVHRFNHWANGWFEIILIAPDSNEFKKADELETALMDYPVIDEELFSSKEQELINDAWNSWGKSELKEIIQTYLELPIDDIILEIDEDKAVEYCHEAMECQDTDCSLISNRVYDCLNRLDKSKVWELINTLEITREDFDNLPHHIYHSLFQAGTLLKDYDTSEILYIPEFISVQYCENQIKLFP